MKNVKKIFTTKKNNYSHGQVDPYEFHKTFYFLCKVYRVLEKEHVPKWSIIVVIIICICGSIAAALCCVAVGHYITIFEVPLITESGTYFIIMVYKLLIISCTFNEKIHYRKCWKAMIEDFEYICTTGSKYREKFFENHLWTRKASNLSGIFICLIAGGMMFCASLALIFYLIQSPENGVRPLPFPFWLPDVDFGKSPIYEITFVFSNVCICTQTSTYIFMMQTQIIWVRQIMSKADVIIWSIEDLLVDVHPTKNVKQKEYYATIIKARMADIIKMHHSMYSLLDDYSVVYSKLLMFEQKMCAPVVCLTAFCAVEKLDAGENPGIMALLCTAAVILLFIPSYMCTVLADKVKSIGDACWNAPFWNAPGNVIGPYFILIMQRSARPLAIQAPGFEEVSLETFADKIKTAYTGFNMLRQAPSEL